MSLSRSVQAAKRAGPRGATSIAHGTGASAGAGPSAAVIQRIVQSLAAAHGVSASVVPAPVGSGLVVAGSSRSMSTASAGSGTAAPAEQLTPAEAAAKAAKRQAFFRRRHVGRDHTVRAQHFDLRLSAVRLTDAANEAARRHGMTDAEAQQWAPLAAGAALYSSLLRGEERLQASMVLADPAVRVDDPALLTDAVCVEGESGL